MVVPVKHIFGYFFIKSLLYYNPNIKIEDMNIYDMVLTFKLLQYDEVDGIEQVLCTALSVVLK